MFTIVKSALGSGCKSFKIGWFLENYDYFEGCITSVEIYSSESEVSEIEKTTSCVSNNKIY